MDAWDGETYVNPLRHVPSCDAHNLNFRQLLHVGYKVASDMGDRYLNALEEFWDVVAQNVTANIYDRHL